MTVHWKEQALQAELKRQELEARPPRTPAEAAKAREAAWAREQAAHAEQAERERRHEAAMAPLVRRIRQRDVALRTAILEADWPAIRAAYRAWRSSMYDAAVGHEVGVSIRGRSATSPFVPREGDSRPWTLSQVIDAVLSEDHPLSWDAISSDPRFARREMPDPG